MYNHFIEHTVTVAYCYCATVLLPYYCTTVNCKTALYFTSLYVNIEILVLDTIYYHVVIDETERLKAKS